MINEIFLRLVRRVTEGNHGISLDNFLYILVSNMVIASSMLTLK